MLTINKAEENELIVTATEKTSITDPTFLFVFKHQVTQVQKAFILADTSDYPAHYNKFTFTEGSTLAKTLDVGQNNYTIYAQESISNLDPDLAEEVERGIAIVVGEEDEVSEFANEQTYKQFAG